MQKKLIVLGAAVVLLVALAVYSGRLYLSRQQADPKGMEEQMEDSPPDSQMTETKAEEPKPAPEEIQSTAGDTVEREIKETAETETTEESYQYVLLEEQGYVNIYLADRVTLYEYTDIAADSLPETLKAEIAEGKGLVDDRELYNFLENYSS